VTATIARSRRCKKPSWLANGWRYAGWWLASAETVTHRLYPACSVRDFFCQTTRKFFFPLKAEGNLSHA
jgi:hypothetical protein